MKASELSFKSPGSLVSDRPRCMACVLESNQSKLCFMKLDYVELGGEAIQGTAESWRDRPRDTSLVSGESGSGL
jgi:hypothetical protein